MIDAHELSPRAPDWLDGGGEMGALMRETDWSQTPLGSVESWSPSLKMMTRFLLANRFPLLLWWGPQFYQLYNDAYRPILGAKHPQFLGRPVSECWSEIWHVLRPLIETPFNGGPATWMEDILLEINRYGFTEESHFTIAYSPVPDETAPGGIGGVLATVHEISEKVVGERRVVALRDLGTRAVEAKTAEEACAMAAATLAKHPLDIPFALLYLIDPNGRCARLAGAAGVTPGAETSPMVIELDALSGDSQAWPLSEVVRTEASQTVENLASRFGAAVPPGPWSDPPRQVVVTPIRSNIAHQLAGLLVVGVSSRLRLDDSYLSFIELAAGQIATAVANATAYDEERRRAEALAEIDRAKTAFFSNVSHEFRTPLTLMLGPLEDILAEDELSPAARERLAVASRNSQRLLKLVNTLLDFSRLEAGRIQAVYEPVDLAAFTTELASVFRSAVEKAGMRLVVACPPLPEAVYVDREMWEKIVLNLLSNAFKFTFEGEIRVGLRRVGEMVELEVSDTGTGIPAEETPHLFERFHRVKGARGRSYEGSGIGLALVQELVKLHGGAVRVSSEVGQGSAFTVSIPTGKAHLPADRIEAARTTVSTSLRGKVYLEEALRWMPEGDGPPGHEAEIPVERLEIEDSTLTRSAAPQSNRPRVLLADDNADMREYLRRTLAERGYAVTAVADGESALKAARAQSFDLVLSDLMMPKLDGFGLLKAVRSDERTRATPVILLSARAGEEARVEGLEAGADDYLVKPFSARELAARVESNLNLASLRREQEARTAADLKAMERLHEVGNICAQAGHNSERCLDEIVGAAIAVMGADKGNIQLLDAESGALRIAAQRGFAEPFLNFFACVGAAEASACAAAMRSAGRVIVEDVTRSEIFAGRSSLNALLEADVRATQATPLISSSGRVFGMISTHFRTPHRPAERDLRLIDLLARQTVDYLERRQAEEERAELLAREQTARAAAEEANRLKDEFLATLSHELRNPLNSIVGNAELLLLSPEAKGIPQLWRAAEVIHRNAMSQAQLVNDLLDLSRLQTGKMAVDRRPIALAPVVGDAIEAIRAEVAAKELELDMALPEKSPVVNADPVRIKQIVWNLVNNAVKFTPKGGQVSVSLSQDGDGAKIVVEDTGQGIEASFLPHIFEMFRQADGGTKRNHGGMGIGLSLVSQIVELHGGEVLAFSEGPGRGARFTVKLPLHSAGSADRTAPPITTADELADARILVIDDSEDSLEILRALLTRKGAKVYTAVNGEEGFKLTKDTEFDLIISDISMPIMDGYEFLKRLRETRPQYASVPAIALTGFGREEDVVRARQAGFTIHLTKPINFKNLLELAQVMLRK